MTDYPPFAIPGPSTPPQPRVEISFSWGVTDGSAPENVSVTWQGVLPSDEILLATIDRLAGTGNRYEIDGDDDRLADEGGSVTGPLLMSDLCRRPSCGHPRQHHPRNGSCVICAESIICPTFAELPPVSYLHPSEDLGLPTEEI